MKRQKQTVDLERFADEARRENAATGQGITDDKLAQLKRNLGKTVLLPTNYLLIQDNVRQMIDTASPEFRKLVNSIRQHGVKQNLLGDLRILADGQWQIICVAGQRRLLAAIEAGREHVPVRLEQYASGAARIVDALSENLLRANLHCLDTAIGYLRLFEAGWSESQIAEAFERQRDTVMKMLRLARYPKAAHDLIRQHPDKFTSTILLSKFVAKSWPEEEKLLEAMSAFVTDARPKIAKRRSQEMDVELAKLLSNLRQSGLTVTAKGNSSLGELLLKWHEPQDFLVISSLFNQAMTRATDNNSNS
jgi:ParB/RepB/Spo0J family partition protein